MGRVAQMPPFFPTPSVFTYIGTNFGWSIAPVEIIQAGLPVLFIGGKLWIDKYEFKFFVETRFETQTLYERNRKVFYLMHVLGGQLPW